MLSEGGGLRGTMAALGHAQTSRHAASCPDFPADKLKDMPNLIHVKSCDEQRAKITG